MNATQPGDVVTAAQAALDTLTAALGRADLEAVLACEAHVAGAAAALGRLDRQLLRRDPALRAQLETLYLTLGRCRRVGGSLADVVRVTRAALGAADGRETYGPHGGVSERATGHALDTQV
ncbi:MAG TPA: hypothetical protein VIY56_17160 [Vicinamibacterales bacterium]